MLGALGLAAACGLNAWLSLLLTGLFVQAGWVHVAPHWSSIGDLPVVAIAAAFFLVDFGIDKLSDVRRGLRGGVFVAAALGAILFDAHAGAHLSWVASVALGGGTAALLHGARAFARPAAGVVADAAIRAEEPSDANGVRAHDEASGGADTARTEAERFEAATVDPAPVRFEAAAVDPAPGRAEAGGRHDRSYATEAAPLDRAVPGLSGATMSLLEDTAAVLLVIVAFSAPALAGSVTVALVTGAVVAAARTQPIRTFRR